MARTTVAETLQRIRRQLTASHRVELDVLNTTVNDSTTSIVLTTAASNFPGLRRGSLISIDTETMRLTADPSGSTLTVLRGFMDSDAAAHTAGAEVWINPQFHPIDILDHMRDEINSWGPDLYRVAGTTLTTADGDTIVEIASTYAGAYGIIDARRNTDTSVIGGSWETWPRTNVRLQRGTATGWTPFTTSGTIIRYVDPIYAGYVFVLFALPFATSTFTTATDLVADVGLAESMLDLLAMGVKLRIKYDDEMANLSRAAQTEPRRSEETPPGSGVPVSQYGRFLYNQRKSEEIAKLRAQWPITY